MKNFFAILVICLFIVFLTAKAEKAGSADSAKPPLLGVVHTQATQGVRIKKILQNSAAERARLLVGDIILSLNGVRIQNPKQLFDEVQRYRAGDLVNIEYLRKGEIKTVQVVLGERIDMSGLIGKKAPDLKLIELRSNQPRSLIGRRVTILDFWATWCEACEPVRQALEAFSRRKKLPIDVMGITNEDRATVEKFLSSNPIGYTILLDEENAAITEYRVVGFPTLVVIDQEGIIRFAGFAANGGLEEALLLAEKLSQKKSYFEGKEPK